MELLAGVAAGAGVTAKEAYSYNRENFLYDRELRRRKEMKVQSFRVEQAELWREDVRDLISLTEYKMHVYLLVNVLLLGFVVALWCQGKLAHTTPIWLMSGYVVAIAGAFVFILLSIWMAMHAAVAAQGFETRLLTQMVRLPIPTWQEIEACRTYASEFERLEGQQMFRVPFVMGKQEGLQEDDSPASDDAQAASTPSTTTGAFRNCATRRGHVDPWGLEGSGANIEELGCKQGPMMVHMRHVRLARQAMVFWQSYDSFARISMSIGVNQLLLAASYFILGYYLAEVKVASSATYGVAVLTGIAETLTRLDLSLSWFQLRLLQLLLFLGPAIATAAGWAHLAVGYEKLAESLVVCAYLAHALYLVFINSLCHLRMEHNGSRLPVAFRSVLYLDVFGWSQGKRGNGSRSSVHSPAHSAFSFWSVGEGDTEGTMEGNANKPATGMIARDVTGRPLPRRPEDAAPEGGAADMRAEQGAPDPERPIEQLGSYAEFFQAGTWLNSAEKLIDEDSIATGHEHEAPAVLPWQVFSSVMNLLCLAWFVAAAMAVTDVLNVWGSTVATYSPEQNQPSAQPPSSLLNFMTLSADTEERFSERVRLAVSWPLGHVEPHGLACDEDGTRFVVSDGLTIFSAEMKVLNADPDVSESSALLAKFSEVNCPPVAGEGLQDVAVTCPDGAAGCEALVLHKSGKRMSACPVAETQTAEALGGYKASVSDAWLEELRVGRSSTDTAKDQPHARIEKAVTLASDSGCKGTGESSWAGCVLLGTTRGRVVRLTKQPGRNGMLSPKQSLMERQASAENVDWKPGSVRSIGDKYFGVLSYNGSMLQIQQKADGQPAGRLSLDAAKASSFCAGGGHLYFMEQGPNPQIWRLPLPQSLSPRHAKDL